MSVSPATATAVPRFAALHVPDYRRYFLFGLLAMTADNIEHVISHWVIFLEFHSPALAGFAVISHWVGAARERTPLPAVHALPRAHAVHRPFPAPDRPRRPLGFGVGETLALVSAARADRRLMTMILLGAATSLFVGSAFQAQMPEYAHRLGATEAKVWYSILSSTRRCSGSARAAGSPSASWARSSACTGR